MDFDEIFGNLKRQQSRRFKRRRKEFEQLQELIYLFESYPRITRTREALHREFRRRIAEAAMSVHNLKAAVTIGTTNWPGDPRLEQIDKGMDVLASQGLEFKSLPICWLRWYPSRARALVDRITACGEASRFVGYVADMLQATMNDIDSGKKSLEYPWETGGIDSGNKSLESPEETGGQNKAIHQEALRAVVGSGIATVLGAADQAPSREKVSAVMFDLLTAKRDDQENPRWWSLNRWMTELDQVGIKCTKTTITGNSKKGVPPCDAWAEIMAWRETNKQSRSLTKPGEKI